VRQSVWRVSNKTAKLGKNGNSCQNGLDKWHLSKYIFTWLLGYTKKRKGKSVGKASLRRAENFICSPHIVKSGNCRKLQIFIDASWQAPEAALDGSLTKLYVYKPPRPPAPPTNKGKTRRAFLTIASVHFQTQCWNRNKKLHWKFQLGKDQTVQKSDKYHWHKHKQMRGELKKGH